MIHFQLSFSKIWIFMIFQRIIINSFWYESWCWWWSQIFWILVEYLTNFGTALLRTTSTYKELPWNNHDWNTGYTALFQNSCTIICWFNQLWIVFNYSCQPGLQFGLKVYTTSTAGSEPCVACSVLATFSIGSWHLLNLLSMK